MLTPGEIRDVWASGELDLSNRNLTSVPDEIFTLSSSLTTLTLSGNQLEHLPPEIGELAKLRVLHAGGNRLTDLPPQLARLTRLHTLDLSGNQLASLPAQLSQLRNLRDLMLSRNELAVVPPVVPRLTRLQTLWLDGNHLTTLPAGIGALAHLTRLLLNDNQLTALPPEIGWLASLVTLHLENNQLEDLPPEIGHLAGLHRLYLDGNRLTGLPPDIAELTELTKLHLRDNQITALPAGLARQLDKSLDLDVTGNPLPGHLNRYVADGAASLAAYLRTRGSPDERFEAKVMLLGEGYVGKTSLAAALRGEAFQARRPPTPGIAVSEVDVPHPDRPDSVMTLRLWDFGGQDHYLITHQLFISPRAIYLLVWNMRAGWAAANIPARLRTIALRIGDAATDGSVRVLTVGTHRDESEGPSGADYAALDADFPGMLAGHLEVDNSSPADADRLRAAIAREATRLPHLDPAAPMSAAWTEWADACRDIEQLARTDPWISFDRFEQACVRSGVPARDVRALAGLLHDLGRIVYYGDDAELADIVVLDPQWLTRAVSRVLTDRPTREAGGVLEYTRLGEIWPVSGYARGQRPYLLRLLEKFSISYRLDTDQGRSFIPQLAPAERPPLEWEFGSPLPPGIRSLTLRCRLDQPVTGLMPWLTVRLHRSSTPKHWQRGMFLRYWNPGYRSEALIELRGDRELTVQVRAPGPDFFFNVIIDSLENLLRERWRGLGYTLSVPCPGGAPGQGPCAGEFRLETLRRRREQGKPTTECQECGDDFDVDSLLTGLRRPRTLMTLTGQAEALEQFQDAIQRIQEDQRRSAERQTEVAQYLRNLLTTASVEVTDCPRVFTLVPVQAKGGRRLELHKRRYRLVLWCEHQGGVHPMGEHAYTIAEPREWFVRVRPYLNVMLEFLRAATAVSGLAVAAALPLTAANQAGNELQAFGELVKTVDRLSRPSAAGSPRALAGHAAPGAAARETAHDEVDAAADGIDGGVLDSGVIDGGVIDGEPGPGPLTYAEGAALRAFREMLRRVDPHENFATLQRARSSTGGFLWLCPEHYRRYDPGLPELGPGPQTRG